MNHRYSKGFALPTVLIASIIMLVVLLASVTSSVAVRNSLAAQYYNQLSQESIAAGVAYAKACLDSNNGIPKWTDASPLKPNTDCSGTSLVGVTCPGNTLCTVASNSDVLSSFSVGMPTVDINGKATNLNVVGTTSLLRTSNGSVWRTYTQSSYSQINPPNVIKDGLILNLDAGDSSSYPGSGTVWTDLSGNGNNINLLNGVGYTNINSGALNFDGVNDYATSSNYSLPITSSFSVSAWMKFNQYSYMQNLNTGTFNFKWRATGEYPYWNTYGQAGNLLAGAIYTSIPSLGQWHYFTLNYDGANRSIYLDGILNNQVATSGNVLAPNDLTIASLGEVMNGLVSEVVVYNRSLSAMEIQQNYNALKGRYQTPIRSSCSSILSNGESIGSGIYAISPTGKAPIQVYCDMVNDGGGWTLVLQNNSTVATPSPTWSDAINNNNVSGSMVNSLSAFDVLVGLGYWNGIGTQLKAQVGSSPSAISHKATYTFNINAGNNYAVNLSNENILLGGTEPGLYISHSGIPFSTYESDHDSYSGNCSSMYGNHPWWYTACWNGNFFAGGAGYQEAAYWVGSTTDYYAHGSIWIK